MPALFAKLLLLIGLLLVPVSIAAQGHFPEYEVIQANVAFWRDIYGKYSNRQGVLHDSRNLAIIYEVLEIEGTWNGAARVRDQARIDAARDKYREILALLATGEAPRNEDQQRVAALFGPTARPEDFLFALENIRFQSGQRDNFREGVIRSGAYLDEIKSIFAEHGLPEELAYLPHVESSFNYKASSKAGAAGIWQFIESTGRQYLTIDKDVDERRDPLKASQAAAKLLRKNFDNLGSWPLAITAYNHGLNGMMRAKAAKGDYPQIFLEHESPLFKFASRNFYPEFLAAVQVAKNYRQYFGELQLEPPVTGGRVDRVFAARPQGVQEIQNQTGQNGWIALSARAKFRPNQGESVAVNQVAPVPMPVTTVKTGAASTLLSRDLYAVSGFERKRSLSLGLIRVEAEETLTLIANWLSVSPNAIRKLNGLGAGDGLVLGDRLKIPLKVAEKAEFENRRFRYHRELAESFFAANRLVEGTRSYRVKPGDTIWSLCQNEFGLPLWLLRKYNASLDLRRLKAGQKLIVPMVEALV